MCTPLVIIDIRHFEGFGSSSVKRDRNRQPPVKSTVGHRLHL